MQRKFRLTRSEDFKRVRRSGRSYAHPLLVLVADATEAPDIGSLRIGIAANRGIGTAVKRNRAKRLLREAVRTLIPSITPGRDLLLIARPPLLASNVVEVRDALLVLLRRAELLSTQVPSDAA